MEVTIKKIAEACRVSRGTVDRVLNNRGRVKAETEALVRNKAEELGYRPNMAGKALAARKKKYVIGVILISEGIEFFDEVQRGIQKAREEIQEYGVSLLMKTMRGYHVEKQLALMEELQPKVQFLILHGINDELIRNKIAEYIEKGVQVLTINADVENSRRLCYVGCNYKESGKTAAGILGLLTGGRACVGIATGTVKQLGHNQRIIGFSRLLKERYPGIIIQDMIETSDDDLVGYKKSMEMLSECPMLSAIYIAAAGAAGVCRAVADSGRAGSVTVVASDSTASVKEWMKKGIIQAVVCQEPYQQGYRSVMAASEYLVKGVIPGKDFIAKNEIRILENI